MRHPWSNAALLPCVRGGECRQRCKRRSSSASGRPDSPAHELNERAGAQAHFIDLCRVLGVPEPADPDSYCFERGVAKTGSTGAAHRRLCRCLEARPLRLGIQGAGPAAWKARCKQLMMYALPLESPPLLVVSDRLRIEVHTHFTGTPSEKPCLRARRDDAARGAAAPALAVDWHPTATSPRRSNRDITEEAARTFAGTAERLRAAGVAPAARSATS